jgi:LuxR family transcriptional regulator, quorum-sensing system regulator LasR
MSIDLDSILSEFSGADQSPEAAIRIFSRLGKALGYDYAAADYLPSKLSDKKVISLSTYSERWESERAQLPMDQVVRDPVLQHLDTRVDPIIWDERDYVQSSLSPLYERFHSHGIGSGVALTIRGPSGDYVCVGFSNEARKQDAASEPTRQLGTLFVAASAMYNRLQASGLVKPTVDAKPLLTPREIECLKWARAGKTGWETSMILGISQATATFHLKNAITKLEASNKTHAVVCAVERGLIN